MGFRTDRKWNEGITIMIYDSFNVGVDRTRQLADKLSSVGYLVLIPNFFTDKQVITNIIEKRLFKYMAGRKTREVLS